MNGTRVLAAACLFALPSAVALAADAIDPAVVRSAFEVGFAAGAEFGPFATIGPFGLQVDETEGPSPRPVITGNLSGWSTTLGGYALLRDSAALPFGASALRIDVEHTDGSVSHGQPTYGPVDAFGGELTRIPSVNGGLALSATAIDYFVTAGIDQERTSLSIVPSLQFDRATGGIETSMRIGAGFVSLTQTETIAVDLIDAVVVDGAEAYSRTTGDLHTVAARLGAAGEARLPIGDGFGFIAGLSAAADLAHTSYDGRSTVDYFYNNLPTSSTEAEASDRAHHLMTSLSASAGPEWRPADNVRFRLVGTVGVQTGVPHVVYPKVNLNVLPPYTDGPAHIGFETRVTCGVKASAAVEF